MYFLAAGLLSAHILAAQPIPGRFIVTLSSEPAAFAQARQRASMETVAGSETKPADWSASPAVLSQRAIVATEQRTFARAVASRGARIVSVTDTVLNSVTLELAGEESADWLRGLPGVVRVTPDRMYWARLDRVLALSQVARAWERIGGAGAAGAGMKIAILDTGIDTLHPGFNDDSLTVPEGFPKTSSEANQKLATKKVVVVRSYEDLAGTNGYGAGLDRNGHGTSAACAAACVVHETRIGSISGVAPKAFLGQYKVLGDNGGGANSVILKGIDDAVRDGMDVLNLSLGSDIAGDPASDEQVQALNAAAAAGAIIAVAAGNAGPDENTINSPGTAEKVLTVGSSRSDRSFTADGTAPLDPNRLSDFSSRGPNSGGAAKPDLVATGDNFYTATTRLKEEGVFYTVTQGTSFATPAVAGAAAVLKAARPGLTSAQYRSLLMHSAAGIVLASGEPAPIRHQGAGRLNLDAALRLPVAVEPVSIKFGSREESIDATRPLALTNVTTESVKVSLRIESFGGRETPALQSPAEFTLAPGQTFSIELKMVGSRLRGEYQGVLLIANSKNDVVARVPYWLGGAAPAVKAITLLDARFSGKAGEPILLGARLVDEAGIAVPGAALEARAITPGSKAELEAQAASPGLYLLALTPASGETIFELVSGEVVRRLIITGE